MRRRIIAVWAGLCLAGAAATSALDAVSSTAPPESPYEEPTPTRTYPVDCREIADEIERDRAGARRTRQATPGPSATPGGRVRFTAKSWSVPEECVDELEDRGLRR
ncbi:hypothetical protein ACH4TX_03825 [Streptomyces sp. NPDC021098]|uniref:hypothetical protein n=1 Tax=unclassified Streptomyces TaxID=2593676 RepID=UPI0037AF7B7E